MIISDAEKNFDHFLNQYLFRKGIKLIKQIARFELELRSDRTSGLDFEKKSAFRT